MGKCGGIKGGIPVTNTEILETAMRQSAVDMSCGEEDFRRGENRVVLSRAAPDARKYLTLPFYCNLVSYGNNVVASVDPEAAETVKEYVGRFPAEHCFETPNLYVLNDAFEKAGRRACFMAEYFLPDVHALSGLPCAYPVRLIRPADFPALYRPEWGNALCEKRRELDVLAAAAFDGEKVVGLAGCSADCASMWQIGVDVLPQYRRKGVASALTTALALEILRRGKVPFYCAAWSNIRSVRNAVKSGFRPAWVEMTVKSADFIRGVNRSSGEKPPQYWE